MDGNLRNPPLNGDTMGVELGNNTLGVHIESPDLGGDNKHGDGWFPFGRAILIEQSTNVY